MTPEELDILASSYLDGEATPEEVALVERDPEVMARVREMQSVQEALHTPAPMSAAVREQHLAAALAAFGGGDRRASLSVVDGGSTVDLTEPVIVPSPSGEDDGFDGEADDGVIDLRTQRTQRRPAPALRWMSAAAGFVIFGFGAVFLASQMNSADDTTDVAAATSDAGSESAEDSFDGDDVATESQLVEADEAAVDTMESETMSPDAEETLAADDAMEDAADEEEAVEESADDASGLFEPPLLYDDVPPEGFFPDEPVIGYADIPTSDDLVDNLDLRWRDPGFARCTVDAPIADGSEVIGYLPIEVTNPDGSTAVVEALYVITGPSYEVILVDPETCTLF